ncbi:MAG: peptidase M48 Ste24p [Firmicutes bacterium HGW-Firmicutes-7]|nr:MAG: peptidase M48 Ste24p [Firmicutes bacterium HGW-Firmicutes-7]
MQINPTDDVDISFKNYVNTRQKSFATHMINGVPDYSFSLDFKLRQKINAAPGMFQFFKAVNKYLVPYMKQQYNLSCIAVGPNQYSDIYEMGQECARKLGIGVPQIFVQPDIAVLNAFTYASDDSAPIIVVTSELIERLTPGELKTVIGHECGHIHNNHGIYNAAGSVILNTATVGAIALIPGLQQVLKFVTTGVRWMFYSWIRAAEVTCDRAGAICSNCIEDVSRTDAKLGFGGAKSLEHINIEEYIKQIDQMMATPVRFLEMERTHPLTAKRILANKVFESCDVLYTWRPEWKMPDMNLISKEEADKRCESFISVLSKKKTID